MLHFYRKHQYKNSILQTKTSCMFFKVLILKSFTALFLMFSTSTLYLHLILLICNISVILRLPFFYISCIIYWVYDVYGGGAFARSCKGKSGDNSREPILPLWISRVWNYFVILVQQAFLPTQLFQGQILRHSNNTATFLKPDMSY